MHDLLVLPHQMHTSTQLPVPRTKRNPPNELFKVSITNERKAALLVRGATAVGSALQRAAASSISACNAETLDLRLWMLPWLSEVMERVVNIFWLLGLPNWRLWSLLCLKRNFGSWSARLKVPKSYKEV